MAGRAFLDTNVLLYMFDGSEPAKRGRAQALYSGLAPEEVVLSTQVLQEFYWNATRKLRPPMEAITAAGLAGEFGSLRVVVLDVPLVLRAIAREETAGIAFWDALIVEAALAGGCTRLLTEDLQDGRTFDGLRVENPFRPRP